MDITIIRSNRKTIGIQITSDLQVIVRAPRRAPKSEIDRVVREKSRWIETHLEKMRQEKERWAQEEHLHLTEEQIRELAKQALRYIPERVKHFSEKIGVTYGKITIRNQKTRWGSCSAKGNLNFNCLLMLTTPEVIDYVVVHELCHRKEMNHSKAFWNEVEKALPDYRTSREWLKKEGNAIMRRMTG